MNGEENTRADGLEEAIRRSAAGPKAVMVDGQRVEQHQTLRLRLALLDQHGVIAFHVR